MGIRSASLGLGIALSFGLSAWGMPCIEIPDDATRVEALKKIRSEYGSFRSLTDDTYAFLEDASPAMKRFLARHPSPSSKDWTLEVAETIRRRIREESGLAATEKADLERRYGLGKATLPEIVDEYQRGFEFFFWTDHSETHMLETLATAERMKLRSPAGFIRYFEPTLGDPAWSRRIDWAIRLHDSRMLGSRKLHPELLLALDGSFFPAAWTARERTLVALLGLLHSKSSVPYAELARWPIFVRERTLPKLVDRGLLSPARAEEIAGVLGSLTAEEIGDTARAASWIRIVDANRPIGDGLRNSSGFPFRLAADERTIIVETTVGSLNLIPAQFYVIYGQLALKNFRLADAPNGRLRAIFPLRISGPIAGEVRAYFRRHPVMRWLREGTIDAEIEAQAGNPPLHSVLFTIRSILGDFPPDLLNRMDLGIDF